MTETIVQINFKYDLPHDAYAALAQQGAEPIAGVQGLIWKVFLRNLEEREAGGIYLFESREAATAYINGPIIAQIRQHPRISAMHIKLFDVLAAPTRVTRGPIATRASA